MLLKVRKARHQDRAIDRTLEGSAHERSNTGRHALDGVVRPTLFADLDAGDATLGYESLFVVLSLFGAEPQISRLLAPPAGGTLAQRREAGARPAAHQD